MVKETAVVRVSTHCGNPTFMEHIHRAEKMGILRIVKEEEGGELIYDFLPSPVEEKPVCWAANMAGKLKKYGLRNVTLITEPLPFQ